MGFGFKHKKGASKETPNKLENKPKKHGFGFFGGRHKDRGARLNKKRSKKMNHKTKNMSKEYPLLARMKLPQVLATVTLSKIEDEAKAFDGAVRKIEYNGKVGYVVIAVSEDELTQSGMSGKGDDSDLGQFAASIRNELILSASLAADLANGMLVMVPTSDALDSLAEFDEFMSNDFKFHWAIYPGQIDSDDDPDTKSEILDGMVSLSKLQEISDNNYDLRQEGSEIVDFDPDDDEPATSSSFDDDSSAMGTYDDDDDEGFDDVEDDDYNPSLDTSDIDTSGVGGIDPTTGGLDSTQPDSNRNVIPNPGQNDSTAPTSTGMDDVSSDEFNDLLQGVTNDASDTSEVNLDDIPADTGYDSSNEAMDASNDVQQTNVPQPSGPGSDNNNGQMMTRDQYSANVSRLEADRLQNENLGISLDPDAFNRLFGNIQPLQFKIAPVDDNDRIGQMANAYRENANSKLRSMSEAKQHSLLEEYNQSVLTAMNQIEERLNIDSEENLVGKQMAQLNADRKKRQEDEPKLIEAQQRSINDQYDENKKKFIQQREEAIARSYDLNHQQELQQALNQVSMNIKNETQNRYSEDRNALLDRRRRLASDIMGQVVSQILKGLQDEAKDYSRHEHAVFDGFAKSINDLYADNYQNELNRKQAERDLIKHDTAVQDAQAAQRKAEQALKDKVKELTDDAERQLVRERQKADEDKERQRKSYEKRLKEKQEIVDALQKANDTSEDRHTRELNEVRRQNNEEKKDLRDQIREARNSSTNSSKQNSIKLITVVAVTTLLAGAGGFGIGINKKTSSQPVTTTQTTHGNGDSGKSIINVYGNGGDSKKSSDSHSTNSDNSTSHVNHSSSSSTEDAGDGAPN